jgi:hypothetical protein
VYRFAVITVAAIGLVHATQGRAAADIIQYESLDLAVTSADLVIRGTVSDILTLKEATGIVWNRVIVKVEETIKGEKLKEVRFMVREAPFEAPGATWRNFRDEMLFCLNTPKVPEGPFRVDYALRGGWIFWAFPLTGAPGTRLPIYSIDFKSLTDAKAILAAARAAAEAPAGKVKSRLEWIVQGPATIKTHAVLYPDTERVRAAARKSQINLLQLKQ